MKALKALTQPARRTYRLCRLALHLLWGAAVVAWVFPFLADARRLQRKQRWSRQLLGIVGLRFGGQLPDIAPGSLIVANHISWLDIYVLNAACPVAFVSKAEVRSWPLVGWLAAKTGTVFLRRGSRGHAKIVNAEIDAILNAGKNVAIFPEGTTTDGTHLLHFHGALLQPAVETGRPVQPVAISYHAADGRRSLAAAYVGETSMLQSLQAILAAPGLEARVAALPALPVAGSTRRELAPAARSAIAARLGIELPETGR